MQLCFEELQGGIACIVTNYGAFLENVSFGGPGLIEELFQQRQELGMTLEEWMVNTG